MKKLYARILRQPYLGLGESYMDGWWDCAELDEFFNRVLKANLENELKDWKLAVHFLKAQIFNGQKKSKAAEVAEKHYDIGNNLYALMLGHTMSYTCAYWRDAQNLDDAEDAKFDLVCRKVGLKPGMKVLDLGCGFGSFLKYAAEKYGVTGVGVNLSKEQMKFAKESCAGLPLDFQVRDYRDAEGTFDRVVSIGLAEHVGLRTTLRCSRWPTTGSPMTACSCCTPLGTTSPCQCQTRGQTSTSFPTAFSQRSRSSWPNGKIVHPRRPAQLWSRLRQDPHGVAQKLCRQLAEPEGRVRR